MLLGVSNSDPNASIWLTVLGLRRPDGYVAFVDDNFLVGPLPDFTMDKFKPVLDREDIEIRAFVRLFARKVDQHQDNVLSEDAFAVWPLFALLSFDFYPQQFPFLAENEEIRPLLEAQGWLSIDSPSPKFACNSEFSGNVEG